MNFKVGDNEIEVKKILILHKGKKNFYRYVTKEYKIFCKNLCI